jgi:hypothetical protein
MIVDASPGSFAALARRCGAAVQRWGVDVARPGSAASLVFAACLGVIAFAAALATGPIAPREAEASAPVRPDLPLTDVSVRERLPTMTASRELAPIGAPPPPAIDFALNFEVAYFWPLRPQTVSEPVAIRDGPASSAKVLRHARPGERLRINGRVEDAPDGPWLRVRLADGSDGYFTGRTVDASSWRRKRPPETAPQAAPGSDAFADVAGAPLMPTPPPDEGPDLDLSGPPSF